jgi:hypothetical protein
MKRAINVLRETITNTETDAGLVREVNQAISLIEAHLKFRECGPMDDSNAALWDLEHSLSIHRDMAKAHEGHPKGEYHLKCIREIEEAIAVLKEAATPSVGESPQKTSGLSFSEALEAVKQGKNVQREQSGGWSYTVKMDSKHAPSFEDMIATDWQIVP